MPIRTSRRRLSPRTAALALIALGMCACAAPAHRAFYYWKTARGPSDAELAIMDRAGADRMYVRLFDVGKTGAATPALSASGKERAAWISGGRRELVPVIYIDNDALAAKGFQPETAAKGLLAGVADLWGSDGPLWRELQIDCDWTATTREAYFALLARLHKGLTAEGRILSATIRLHQVKYRSSTGVPPVDRGMLMAYNLLAPDLAGEKSAILDSGELEGYLAWLKSYPLQLDVALPAFSWVVQYEGGRLLGLISDPRAIEELESPAFRSLGGNGFCAMERGFLAGRSVETGDVFVIDDPGITEAGRAAERLAGALPAGRRTIAIYHLDSDSLSLFTGGHDESFEALFSPFHAVRGRGL